jgi:NADH-quinone oxidoreductase subunit K
MAMRVDFFLVMAALLFSIGCVGVLIRRNVIVILMSIELMLNAVNLTFVAFAHELRSMTGHVFSLFVITVAACEAAVGLAIVLALFRRRQTTDVDDVSLLRW